MNEQPLDDDAELLRSLKPTRPEINWQKILSHVPQSSISQKEAVDNPVGQPAGPSVRIQGVLPDRTGMQPRIKHLVSSWWSGALAGSLITFALLRYLGPQWGPNGPQDRSVAQYGPSISNNSQRPTESADGAINSEPQRRNRPQRDMEGWDPIVDSGVWSSRFKRHGLGEKLVSNSTPRPTESIQIHETAPNSSDGFPKSQAELRRELLDFN
jgi:hypothetical protein